MNLMTRQVSRYGVQSLSFLNEAIPSCLCALPSNILNWLGSLALPIAATMIWHASPAFSGCSVIVFESYEENILGHEVDKNRLLPIFSSNKFK